MVRYADISQCQHFRYGADPHSGRFLGWCDRRYAAAVHFSGKVFCIFGFLNRVAANRGKRHLSQSSRAQNRSPGHVGTAGNHRGRKAPWNLGLLKKNVGERETAENVSRIQNI